MDDDVFCSDKKCILKGVFGVNSTGFVVIGYYTFSNKVVFLFSFLTHLNAFNLKKGHILNLLF